MSALHRIRPGPLLSHPITVLAIALLALPHLVERAGSNWTLAGELIILAMVALGYNLLAGYAGLMALGHGLFFGAGAYATALLQTYWFYDSALLPLVTATALSTLLGLGVGYIALRGRALAFCMVTFVFGVLGYLMVPRWLSFLGGAESVVGIQRAWIAGRSLEDPWLFYHLTALCVLLVAAMLWRVTHAPLGTVLVAIRENQVRAQALGYPVARVKLIAFSASAGIAGLGGGLYALLQTSVTRAVLHPDLSVEILMMTLIGGAGSFLGPALGALVYVVFRTAAAAHTLHWQAWYGLLFLGVLIVLRPNALSGLPTGLVDLLTRWRARGSAGTPHPVDQPVPEETFMQLPVPAYFREHPPVTGSLVSCDLVEKRFEHFAVVQGVNLYVADRQLHALLGPNGAGKSTLVDVMVGTHRPDHGAVRLAGTAIGGLPPDQITLHGLSRTLRNADTFEQLTVRENLRLGVQARHPRRFHPLIRTSMLVEVEHETTELIEFLGLQQVAHRAVTRLTRADRQRVGIGMALATRPRALILDEPFAALNPAECARLAELLHLLREFMGVVLVERDMERALSLADRVSVMSEGRIRAEGSPQLIGAQREVRNLLGRGGRPVDMRQPDVIGGASPVLLEVKGLDVMRGNNFVLRDLNLQVCEKDAVVLIGGNGAGKTTLLHAILGLQPARAGLLSFNGTLLSGQSAERIARLGIGYAAQNARLFAGLTVEENLRLGTLAHTSASKSAWTTDRLLDLCPLLKDRLTTRVDQLTRGEQRMAAIARGLASDPKLLLLDEPCEGLDGPTTAAICAIIRKLRGQVTLLMTDHQPDGLAALANRVVVVEHGRVVFAGPARGILTG